MYRRNPRVLRSRLNPLVESQRSDFPGVPERFHLHHHGLPFAGGFHVGLDSLSTQILALLKDLAGLDGVLLDFRRQNLANVRLLIVVLLFESRPG